MSLWEDILLLSGGRPRVVHRLPGRLRVNIPLLKRVPDEWKAAVAWIERVLAAPPGILAIQSDGRTGNVLLRYDPAEISEADLLQWLRGACAWARRHRDRLRRLSPAEAEKLIGRMETKIRSRAGMRLTKHALEEWTDVWRA